MDNFDLKKIKAYKIKDGERTVSVLFYDNDFFAIDRVNFKEGYEYNPDKEFFGISENLNYRIKKIPNVAKTRKILNIEDIETNGSSDIQDIKHEEYKINLENVEKEIENLEFEEEKKLKEERSIKNRIRKITEKARTLIVEPFKLLRNKLMKTNQVKMLSDGKHSIFDKED